MKYKIEVNTYGDPPESFAGNAITYASKAQAKHAVENLFQRWTAVKSYRVVDQDNKVILTGPE